MQSRSVFGFLHARYLSGDEDPFIVAFPNYETFRRERGALFDEVGRRVDRWQPSRFAVMLELGLWVLDRKWPDGPDLLHAARTSIVRRATPPGLDEAQDNFERTFHHIAIASLVSSDNLGAAKEYLLNTDTRISSGAAARGRLTDPRWQFIKAWVAEFQGSPHAFNNQAEGVPTLVSSSRTRSQVILEAAGSFKRAMESPEVNAEATVRYAFAQHRLGEHQGAASALRQIDPRSMDGDLVLEYWRAIIAGRVYEALGERTAAEREYRTAVSRWAGAQTPLVALASLLERQGQSSEAERFADRVRLLPEQASDPWWIYWNGDNRFVKQWRRALRDLRP
jgi:hypothetical protein